MHCISKKKLGLNLVVILCLFLSFGLITACDKKQSAPMVSPPSYDNKHVAFNGVDITGSASFRNDLAAIDVNGKTFNLKDTNYNNKPIDATLVTFGFTQCPEYCPTTLAKIVQIQNKFAHKNIRVVFITVDPTYDTASVLKKYLAAFSKQFIGISVAQNEVEKIQKNFNVFAKKQGDNVDHTTGVYLLDKNSAIRLYFPYNLNATQMMKDIEVLY